MNEILKSLSDLVNVKTFDKLDKFDLSRIRHEMMIEYGWIPEREFYEEQSTEEFMRLTYFIMEKRKQEKRAYDKVMRKSGGL